MSGQWAHSLFGCFDNFGTCIIAYFVPCVTYGQNAAATGEGSCISCGFAFLLPIVNIILWVKLREKIRQTKGIAGSTFNDCMTILCCPLCALVQEAQEVQGGGPSAQSMCRE